MFERKLLNSAIAVLVGIAGVSNAAAFEIPCGGAPKEAVVEVPANIMELMGVTCTKYGHLLSGPGKVLWNYPGAFAPALLFANPATAALKTEPPVVNHASHFTSIAGRDLDQAELVEHFRGGLAGLARQEAPSSGLLITAVNNQGLEQHVYIFTLPGGSRWGYLCSPECATDMPFMVLDMSHR